MKPNAGMTGLIIDEPLLWEKGNKGRCGYDFSEPDVPESDMPDDLCRESLDFPDLSEVDVVRHFTRLSQWNFGVDTGMYPLGSCTMKYNPKTHERQISLPEFSRAHPLLPPESSQGLLKLMKEMETCLTEITGLDAVTLQPAAGAHGELCGMLMMHAYHQKNGKQRSKIIIPDTAHGTNPASAALCGYTPVKITTGPDGILTPEIVRDVMDEDTSGIMLTNPNTLGLFETHIRDIAAIVHDKGGLVYCDGANMNAVMGVIDMGKSGVDVLHLNLHKTFATPHGGGGPGAGPVCVAKRLEPFLPVPRITKQDNLYIWKEDYPDTIGRLHAFNGNVGVIIRAYCYILTMGGKHLTDVSRLAVINANYIKEQLKSSFHLPYDKPCMHECVFSDKWQQANKITTLDIAKRLMDYGFHPPTIYFPLVVNGSLMIEPTETESRENLDQFIAAMKSIAEETKVEPDSVRQSPLKSKVRRLDEASAARKPCLAG